jgi:hypothetical protein
MADYRGPGARLSGRAFSRTSHIAHGSPSASRARLRRRLVHLGVSRGDLGAHPRCSDTSSAFEKEGRLRGPCSYWPTAAPLVRNSPRGWTPRSLTTIRSTGRRAVRGGCCRRSRPLRRWCRYDISGAASIFLAAIFLAAALPCADDLGAPGVDRLAMATSRQPKRRCFVGSARTNLRDGKSLRCPPSRRVPHKWSGRRPHKYTAAQRPFRYETRRTCLSSEGGHRRLCATTSPPARRPQHAAMDFFSGLAVQLPQSLSPPFRRLRLDEQRHDRQIRRLRARLNFPHALLDLHGGQRVVERRG